MIFVFFIPHPFRETAFGEFCEHDLYYIIIRCSTALCVYVLGVCQKKLNALSRKLLIMMDWSLVLCFDGNKVNIVVAYLRSPSVH